MRALITGTGNMGRAIRAALEARGDAVEAMVGRAGSVGSVASADVAFEFSHADALLPNVRLALDAGCQALVIGTTGWSDEDGTGQQLRRALESADARAVVAPTFSLAAVLFAELAEQAARLFGRFPEYDPFVLEQHRRSKPDRPSGTALAIAGRLLPHLPSKREARLAEGQGAPDPDALEVVALRAGSHPGMHVVGFDGPGEALELRITARDRSAYVNGALLAADWLLDHPSHTGITDFTTLVRERTTSTQEPRHDDRKDGPG
jgi:4-hydroxy-tetrahydrodipicolinate reductase